MNQLNQTSWIQTQTGNLLTRTGQPMSDLCPRKGQCSWRWSVVLVKMFKCHLKQRPEGGFNLFYKNGI